MLIRFLQVVYWLSLAWLSAITVGWLNGEKNAVELLVNTVVFGWPAVLGLLACFVFSGRFLLPPKG